MPAIIRPCCSAAPKLLHLFRRSVFPIGLFPEAEFPSRSMRFEPGDSLVMFTDGINEATDIHGEEFGMDRLSEVVRSNAGGSAETLQRSILEAVTEFCHGAEQADDMDAASRAVHRKALKIGGLKSGDRSLFLVPLQNFVEHRPGPYNREAHPALHCFLDLKWLGLARIVLPGEPHHITQRGNRRLEVFRTESGPVPVHRTPRGPDRFDRGSDRILCLDDQSHSPDRRPARRR